MPYVHPRKTRAPQKKWDHSEPDVREVKRRLSRWSDYGEDTTMAKIRGINSRGKVSS